MGIFRWNKKKKPVIPREQAMKKGMGMTRKEKLLKYAESRLETKNLLSGGEKIYCVFCGERIRKGQYYDTHHLRGRTGELMIDEDYMRTAHTQCHFDYHNLSAHKIPWFNRYLLWVKDFDSNLYFKESQKLTK